MEIIRGKPIAGKLLYMLPESKLEHRTLPISGFVLVVNLDIFQKLINCLKPQKSEGNIKIIPQPPDLFNCAFLLRIYENKCQSQTIIIMYHVTSCASDDPDHGLVIVMQTAVLVSCSLALT